MTWELTDDDWDLDSEDAWAAEEELTIETVSEESSDGDSGDEGGGDEADDGGGDDGDGGGDDGGYEAPAESEDDGTTSDTEYVAPEEIEIDDTTAFEESGETLDDAGEGEEADTGAVDDEAAVDESGDTETEGEETDDEEGEETEDEDPVIEEFVSDDVVVQEELTGWDEFAAAYEEGGAMAAYSKRHVLIDAVGGTFFNWFPSQRKFPEVNFNFVVMAGLDFLGEFQAVQNIGYQVPVKEVNEGGRNHSPHFLPFSGPGRRGNLKLTWGSVSSTTLGDWIEAVNVGWDFRRTVYVVQLARDGLPTRIMRFAGCWPTGWEGSDLETSGSSWALQSLTLVHDRFNMLTVPFDLGSVIS